jgi:4-amino-4-deoxy-L-arabinose transferase-like glycosyltransferase
VSSLRRRLEDPRLWLALAFVLRLAFALKLGGREHQIDELGFRMPSLALARTGTLADGGRAIVVPPVPFAFFALFYKLGESMIWPRLGQVLVGTVTVWLLGRATQRLSGSKLAGLLALALAAVYPYFIYYGGMLMSETLDLALLIPGLWWLCEALARRDENARGLAAAGGLTLGLAGLCRPEGAYIALVIWALAALRCLRGSWPWRAWVTGLVVWLVPLLGWCARNRVQTGAFALDMHGGISLLHGTEYFDLNDQDTGKAMDAIKNSMWYMNAQALPEAERNAVYVREATRWMSEHPKEVAVQWAKKLWLFWRPIPRLHRVYAESEYSHPAAGAPRWALVAASALFEPWLILLGFAGLWAWRGRLPELFPLYVWVAATTAVHVISVSQPRYRVAVMPVLMLAACAWLAARLPGGADASR